MVLCFVPTPQQLAPAWHGRGQSNRSRQEPASASRLEQDSGRPQAPGRRSSFEPEGCFDSFGGRPSGDARAHSEGVADRAGGARLARSARGSLCRAGRGVRPRSRRGGSLSRRVRRGQRDRVRWRTGGRPRRAPSARQRAAARPGARATGSRPHLRGRRRRRHPEIRAALISDGRCLGFLFGSSRRTVALDEDELDVLGTVGIIAATLLDGALAREELQHLDALKSEFIALAAHELRSPASSIYGSSRSTTSAIRWASPSASRSGTGFASRPRRWES